MRRCNIIYVEQSCVYVYGENYSTSLNLGPPDTDDGRCTFFNTDLIAQRKYAISAVIVLERYSIANEYLCKENFKTDRPDTIMQFASVGRNYMRKFTLTLSEGIHPKECISTVAIGRLSCVR